MPEDRRRQIEQVLLAAVERGISHAEPSGGGGPAPVTRMTGGELAESVDPSRLDLAAGSYRIPSYGDEGKLTGVKLLKKIHEGRPGMYRLHDEPSPLDGSVIVAEGFKLVMLGAPRWVSAGTLTEVLQLGLGIFGTNSFAIVVGGTTNVEYLAIGTERPVASSEFGEPWPERTEQGEPTLPEELLGRSLRLYPGHPLVPHPWAQHGMYSTRAFITSDRIFIWPNTGMAALWFAQLEAEARKGIAVDIETSRVLVFFEIDDLVDEIEAGDDSNLQKAADLLSRLNEQAFSLVDWQTKVRYLKVLLAAWTWEEEEKAVVEIFKSLKSDSEVDAVVDMLKRAGRYNQLFNDLDSQLYELLTVVGERFPRERGPLTFWALMRLFQSMGLLPRTPLEALTGLRQGPDGTIVPPELLDKAQEAAMGFVRMGADLGESILTIFTDPGKVAQGILALAQLVVKSQLAAMGYPPAMIEINQLLTQLGEKVLYGMRGADRLGAGDKVRQRIAWRLVLEIASIFISIGAIKAVIQAAGIGEKLTGVIRLLGILARLGEVADVEVEGTRLARLATLLKAERSVFKSVDEVADLLSHLPEEDVRKLGQLLSKFEIKEGEALADLAARSSDLHRAANDALAKAELLQTIVRKAGGLTEEIGEAFRTLVGRDGLELGEARQVVGAIPEGEGARFAATLKRIPLRRLAADSRAAFLELVAGSVERMDAVAKVGIETFSAVSRRAAGKAEDLDRYIGALDQLEARFAKEGKQADFRRLLDGLERDDPSAWLQVENEKRLAAGEKAINAWADQLAGSPKAQRALDKLLRRRGDRVVDGLIDDLAGDKGLVSDPDVVLALEKVDELGERELDGVIELQRYMNTGGEFPQWNELLFAPPAQRKHIFEVIADLRDPANPSNLVVREGLDKALNAALVNAAGPMTGGFGHFEVARTLLRQCPGARMRFEVTRWTAAGRRDVDIVLEFGGRELDVEVKGYKAAEVRSRMKHVSAQIRKDLLNHVADDNGPWANVLWRFPDPGYGTHLGTVRDVFIEELRAVDAAGLLNVPLPQAEAALRARFADPPPLRLIDVLP